MRRFRLSFNGVFHPSFSMRAEVNRQQSSNNWSTPTATSKPEITATDACPSITRRPRGISMRWSDCWKWARRICHVIQTDCCQLITPVMQAILISWNTWVSETLVSRMRQRRWTNLFHVLFRNVHNGPGARAPITMVSRHIGPQRIESNTTEICQEHEWESKVRIVDDRCYVRRRKWQREWHRKWDDVVGYIFGAFFEERKQLGAHNAGQQPTEEFHYKKACKLGPNQYSSNTCSRHSFAEEIFVHWRRTVFGLAGASRPALHAFLRWIASEVAISRATETKTTTAGGQSKQILQHNRNWFGRTERTQAERGSLSRGRKADTTEPVDTFGRSHESGGHSQHITERIKSG